MRHALNSALEAPQRITPLISNPCVSQAIAAEITLKLKLVYMEKLHQVVHYFIYTTKVKIPIRVMLFNLTPDSLLVSHIKLIIASFYSAAIETQQFNSLPNYYYQIIFGIGSRTAPLII